MEEIKIKRLTNKLENPFGHSNKNNNVEVIGETEMENTESTEVLNQSNQTEEESIQMVDSKSASQEEKMVKKDPNADQVTIIKQADAMINHLRNTIAMTIDTEIHLWNVKFDCDKSIEATSPFQRLIDLFDLYTGKFKKEHMEYLKEHDLLPKNEEEVIDTKEIEGKDPITEIKQIKTLK